MPRTAGMHESPLVQLGGRPLPARPHLHLPRHPSLPCSEVEYALSSLRALPHNESAWSYLSGLAARAPGAPPAALATDARMEGAAHEALLHDAQCVPALGQLADVRAQQAAVLLAAAVAEEEQASGELRRAARAAREDAAALLRDLQVADPMRRGFYLRRARQLPAC